MPDLLSPLPATPQIGPLFAAGAAREHYEHKLNETCSLTDGIFQDKTSVPTNFIEFTFSNPLKVATPLPTNFIIEQYRENIKTHVERRILFAFQQLIVCYQTKLHFQLSGALAQAVPADAIFLKINSKEVKFVVRQAAHGSTNPCLIAYDYAEWQSYQSGQAPKPQGFVFLEGTDYYRCANATENLPKWINDADREIDEKTRLSLLREKLLLLINEASQGRLTPEEGIIRFMQDALFEIQAGLTRLQSQNKHVEVQQVLTLYEEYFTEFQEEIENDPSFLESFLNINLGNSHDENAKRVILKIRYAAIRNSQVAQAGLIQKIETIRSEILGIGRKPNHFDAAFRTLLVEAAPSLENRQRLEKLLNFSPDTFKALLKNRAVTTFENTKEKLATHVPKIRQLADQLACDMYDLRVEETQTRALVIKKLRAMKEWSQRRLSAEVKSRFPNAVASQSTICRIENCQKLVTPPIAKEFSRVFNVDPGLFMPHFFYA